MNKVLSCALLVLVLSVQAVSAAPSFTDVDADYQYADSIRVLSEAGVITGYPNGTFQPAKTVNRAELLVLAYRSQGIMLPAVLPRRCFPDVDPASWYASVVCAAKDAGYVSGYADGTFRPAQTVNLSEAAKIVSFIAGLELTAAHSGEAWYVPYLGAMADQKYLPPSFAWVGQPMSRGELAEMLNRIRGNIHDRDSAMLTDLATRECKPIGDDVGTRYDMDRIRAVWVGWMNEVRAEAGLPAYAESRQLDRTATLWAQTMRDKAEITHRRNPSDAYYDYAKLGTWFSAQGITAKAAGTGSYSETIGWSTVSCKESDCTDEMLIPLRAIFDLYLKEKDQQPGTFARSHYESVANPAFTQIGLGIALSGDKVYATTHYVTSIASDPAPICR